MKHYVMDGLMGKMKAAGIKQLEAAKSDGRWIADFCAWQSLLKCLKREKNFINK